MLFQFNYSWLLYCKCIVLYWQRRAFSSVKTLLCSNKIYKNSENIKRQNQHVLGLWNKPVPLYTFSSMDFGGAKETLKKEICMYKSYLTLNLLVAIVTVHKPWVNVQLLPLKMIIGTTEIELWISPLEKLSKQRVTSGGRSMHVCNNTGINVLNN